jgi:hypothetical protein
MRQITARICTAFEQRRTLKINNSQTDGTSLWLFGNKIAEWREDGIWITDAGWQSKTTKERLNGLTGVQITQRAGSWYLNGNLWQGEWTSVSANNTWISIDGSGGIFAVLDAMSRPQEPQFDTTSEWNGKYSKPIYSVFHTHVESELQAIERSLNYLDIQTRRMYSDTDREYKPNHFIIVPVSEFDRAKTLINN